MLPVAVLLVVLVVLIVGLPHLRSSQRTQVEVFIESEVLAHRRTSRGPSVEPPSSSLCPRCGATCDRADSFCRHCGTRVKEG